MLAAIVAAVVLVLGFTLGNGGGEAEPPKEETPIVDSAKPTYEKVDEKTLEVTWLINNCSQAWHYVDASGEGAVLIGLGYKTKVQDGMACSTVMKSHTETIVLDSEIADRDMTLNYIGEGDPIRI